MHANHLYLRMIDPIDPSEVIAIPIDGLISPIEVEDVHSVVRNGCQDNDNRADAVFITLPEG